MSTDIEQLTLTSLPPELFLSIFSYLPQRTTRTVVSPLETTTRTSPSKRSLQSLSFTSTYLRNVCEPHVFESVHIKSLQQLRAFASSDALSRIGGHVKRLLIRWGSIGDVLGLDQQRGSKNEINEAATLIISLMKELPAIKTIVFDFLGAFEAMEQIFTNGVELKELQNVSIRNGRYQFGGNPWKMLQGLGQLRKLRAISLDGNGGQGGQLKTGNAHLELGSFKSLVSLEVTGLSTISAGMLHSILVYSKNLSSLTVRNCSEILLSEMRRLLVTHGNKLRSLTLELIKPKPAWGIDESVFDHDRFPDDEHLCPAIRDYCTNLEMLDLYTDKICKEVVFHVPGSRGGSGAMTSGLPTPPGSPDPEPTTGIDIPTPPFEAADTNREVPTSMLPPPLYSFTHADMPAKDRVAMKSLSLRIPYDASCFGTNSRGPSLQQIYTSLCDGMEAHELLEIGSRAYKHSIADVVKIRGHWKGGPYLFMSD